MGDPAEGLAEAFEKKEKVLKTTWKTRLDPQMAETPEFDDVFRETRRAFRQSEIFDLTLAALNGLNRK